MKLNQHTIDTLKNFAGINTNILIKEGDELSTISTMRNIFARAKVSDSFTNQFGIYDLNEFLSAVSGFSKPELSLKDKYMTISSEGSKSKVKYYYSDPSVIVSPTKEVNMPDADVTFSLGDALRPGSILDSHDELQVQEMINISRLAKRANEKDVQVMIEGPGHVPLNEVAANVRLAKSLIGDVPYYVLGPLVTDIASGHDHIASAIGAAVSASEGVDLLCYLTPSEHLALPNAEEVKAGLIAYRIAAHAGDLVKLREKSIKWDMKMTEARRTLDWEKQLALSIDPENAAKIHGRTGQHPGNNVPCTMCGGACVYLMLPQQRKYEKAPEKLEQSS